MLAGKKTGIDRKGGETRLTEGRDGGGVRHLHMMIQWHQNNQQRDKQPKWKGEEAVRGGSMEQYISLEFQ